MPQEYGKKEIVRHVNELIAQLKNKTYQSPLRQNFAEVYIEDGRSTQGGESIPQKQAVSLPPADEKREMFTQMRRLVQTIGFAGGPGNPMQKVLFYKQGKFMENFEDDYEGFEAFSRYFPSYHMMSYEQLRTYFTWRTGVRKGVVRKTSLSYAFVYIYELINNIGVRDCQDGLGKLVFFWNEYRQHENKLDKYMNDWIRDYYVTNDFTGSFHDVLQMNETLQKLYSRPDPETFFDFYYPYSDYKATQSAFYTPQTEKMIIGCFNHVVKALNEFTAGRFYDLIFYGSGGSMYGSVYGSTGSTWIPFSKALYCSSARKTKDKTVQFSDTEIYRCENGRWTSSKNRIHRENGRHIVGYIFRRIEQFYRKATKYKYKLSADRKKISFTEIARQIPDPENLFAQIDKAILEYYRLSQRKVITVNIDQLETIRANAQMIQEKLLVSPEEPESSAGLPAAEPAVAEPEAAEQEAAEPEAVEPEKNLPAAETADPWAAFSRSLDPVEKTAVRMILRNASVNDLHAFLKSSGMMLEVIADNINQKAIETVNDTIMELTDEITVFDEYRDALERVISVECK